MRDRGRSRPAEKRSRAYAAAKAQFHHRRRKIRLGFDRLFALFAGDVSNAEIARRAGVSRTRLNALYKQYFAKLFAATALQRLRARERSRREEVVRRVTKAVATDRAFNAIKASAAKAKPKRTVEPVIIDKIREPKRQYSHRAVLVDGKDVEAVHHIRNAGSAGRRGLTYATTTLYRNRLKRTRWTIFFVDVPRFPRRVIRSRNATLLRRLFADGQTRVSVYLPLDGRPQNPRHDFLADEDRWH
jgi:AraC-like DNA-binding protein